MVWCPISDYGIILLIILRLKFSTWLNIFWLEKRNNSLENITCFEMGKQAAPAKRSITWLLGVKKFLVQVILKHPPCIFTIPDQF